MSATHTPGPVEVTQYGAREGGIRAVGVRTADGMAVLVTPPDAKHNEAAKRLALDVGAQSQADAVLRAALEQARAEVELLKEVGRNLDRKLAEARQINDAAIAGRRRFFGPVLMKPVISGDWSGEVWLLDPVKLERGTGLRFISVAEVRALHPELWVVSTTADGVLLDAWGGQ